MNKKLQIAVIAFLCALTVPSASFAHVTNYKRDRRLGGTRTLFEARDSAKVHDILLENAPHEFDLPGVANFAVLGTEDRFYLSIGGFVKTTVSYDFGNPMDDPNDFIPSAIPMSRPKGDNGLIQFSAMQSQINLNFVALPNTDNQIGLFVSGIFLDNYKPELQFAYLKYRGFEAGYDYTLFSDPQSAPPTIDHQGPNAFTAIQTGMLSYSHKFGKRGLWQAGIGVEMPMYSATPGNGAATLRQRVPDIPAFVQYTSPSGNTNIRLSAILRNLYYRDDVAQRNINKVGYGFQFSGYTQILPGLTGFWQAVAGRGIASHIQDLSDLGLDLTPDASRPGLMKAPLAWGAFAGLQYDFSAKLYASACYSHVRAYADKYSSEDSPWSSQYSYGQYISANLFWNINSIFSTGIEYLYGRRVDLGGNQAHDNRVQCMFQLNF